MCQYLLRSAPLVALAALELPQQLRMLLIHVCQKIPHRLVKPARDTSFGCRQLLASFQARQRWGRLFQFGAVTGIASRAKKNVSR